MCLFPRHNLNENSIAYKRGITEFDCGVCPECLSKKSSLWALRCYMESLVSQGMMITLTYDTYKYDKNGNIIGENVSNLSLSKDDCQRFMKRLRKRFPKKKIKYLICGEYGKRTGRPHYHAIIFGVQFDDLIFYKRSKRGNVIYKSKTLNEIWQGGDNKERQGGICTVDCINITPAVARYCTKYCAKDSGVDDTFMLVSRGIGDEMLIKRFNGKSYYIDGREYPVPRLIWKKYIENKYNISGYSRYIPFIENKEICMINPRDKMNAKSFNARYKRWNRSIVKRSTFLFYRDNDVRYKRYITYWKRKADIMNILRPSPFDRILQLDDRKYWAYKRKCISAFFGKSLWEPWNIPRKQQKVKPYDFIVWKDRYICRPPSRLYTADDTEKIVFAKYGSCTKQFSIFD